MNAIITSEEIKAWRKGLKMTQAELGAELGVDGNTVWRWESGRGLPESPRMLRLALIGLDSINMSETQLKTIQEYERAIRKNLAESNIFLSDKPGFSQK